MDDRDFENKIKKKLERFEYTGEPSAGAMADFMSRLGTTVIPPSGWALWKPYLVAAAMVTSVAFNVYFWRLYNEQDSDIQQLRNSMTALSGGSPTEAERSTVVDTIYVYKEVSGSVARVTGTDRYGSEDISVAGTYQTSLSGGKADEGRAGALGAQAYGMASDESDRQISPAELFSNSPQSLSYLSADGGDHLLSLSPTDIRRANRFSRLAVAETLPERKEAKGIPLSVGVTAGTILPSSQFVNAEFSGLGGLLAGWRVNSRWQIAGGVERYQQKYSVQLPPIGQSRPHRAPRFDGVRDFPDGPDQVMVASDVLEVPLLINYSLNGNDGRVNPFVTIGMSGKWITDQQFTIDHQQRTDTVKARSADFAVGTLDIGAGVAGRLGSKMTWQATAMLGKDLVSYGAESARFDNLKLQAGLSYNLF